MADIIPQEIAQTEIDSWLDFKKISDKKRESLKGNIESLVSGIMDGTLALDPETFVLTQKLNFPIGTINELKYKARLKMDAVQSRLSNVRPGDMYGTSFGWIAALTDQPVSIIKQIDNEDYTLADHLSFFFMA